jgi:hypothetical protein
MSGTQFQKPKLLVSNRPGACAMCAEEFDPGFPIWWFNGKPYCAHHSEAEISTEAGETSIPSPVSTNSAPPASVDSRFWISELDKLSGNITYSMKLVADAIKENTKMMEKIWNERRP